MQAVSGAGYPGVPSLDILGNVVPFISGEEEKIEMETRKILGSLRARRSSAPGEGERPHEPRARRGRAHRDRLGRPREGAPFAELRAAFEGFTGAPQRLGLPFAPERPIVYLDQPNRPQPRFDAGRGRG